ncbi:HET-domain-containing protein [Stipitochalara longipes BDJ]|nr:HET-domain-containing protein [Stipitochalara longipes BDJ]
MFSTYQYEKMPIGKWIRLLRLFPGVSDEQIQLELFTTELDSAPPYEAISYCWGDPNDQQDIICCGQTMSITRSLYTGLKCFRDPEHARILWADAICINQSNDDEKGVQVTMMGDVYDHAFRVLVWLGDASIENAKEAFNLIRKINEYIESQIVESELVVDPWKAILEVPKLVDRKRLFQTDSQSQALRNLLSRPWFYRLWVLQEVALATSVCVFYGSLSINFSEVVLVGLILSLHSELQDGFHTGRLVDAFQDIFTTYAKANTWIQEKAILSYSRNYISQNSTVSFIQIVQTGARFQASNPLDHIYAFLGHPTAKSKNGDSGMFEANYSLTIEEATQRLVEWLYERDHRLDFLCDVSHHNPSELQHFPSWMPKFYGASKDLSIDHQLWNADNHAMTENFVETAFPGSMLQGLGVIFDTIRACSEPFTQQKFKSSSPDPVEVCWQLQAEVSQTANVEERLKAFSWTLVGGGYTGGGENLQRDFESYCRKKVSSQVCAAMSLRGFGTQSTNSIAGSWEVFESVVQNTMSGRRFFMTEDGRFGLGPWTFQVGDNCCVLLGCRMPLVIRPTSTKRHYMFLGSSYVHGAMNGAAVEGVKSASDLTEITLV